MQEESTISKEIVSVKYENSGFYDPKALITTANMQLYRISKQGKYFLIKTTKDNSDFQLQMLKREYELSIGCSHPHIVHVYTYERIPEIGDAIVMEYIEGCTLKEYLTREISKKERNRLFEELLSAVGYLHKQGITHNDLKPENILVSYTDHSLKLIDFGLADNDSNYVLRTLGYTPRYASPELLRHSDKIDARSDIYSLGVIMREIVGNSAIAKRCTKENPEKRYANIEALQRAWSNRHRPYFVAVLAIALVMIALPSLLYMYANGKIDRKQQQLDAMQQELESKQQKQDIKQQQLDTLQQRLEAKQKEQLLQQQQLDTLRQELELRQEEENEKQKKQEELLAQVDKDIAAIYKKTQDSIRMNPYIDFNHVYQINFPTSLLNYKNKFDKMVLPPELAAIITNRFHVLFNKYTHKLLPSFIEKHKASQSSYRDVEPQEHWPFYDSLKRRCVPYKPHPNRTK